MRKADQNRLSRLLTILTVIQIFDLMLRVYLLNKNSGLMLIKSNECN